MSEKSSQEIRSRIVGLIRLSASELKQHPLNPRLHSEEQRGVLAAMLDDVGYASVIIVYQSEKYGGWTIIDGHLRQDILGSQEVDCLHVDLDDREAEKLLATHDKISGMATYDDAVLAQLLDGAGLGKDVNLLFGDIAGGMEDELDGFDFGGEETPEEKPKYELVPNLDEGYDYVIVFCRRESEMAQLETVLDLPRKEYKSKRVGTSHVLTFGEFLKRWNR